MAESFTCPSCGTKYGWKAEVAGERVRCKKCSGQFVVLAQTPAPPPAAHLADLFEEDAAAMSARTAEADPFAQDATWTPPPAAPERHRALTVDNNTVASIPQEEWDMLENGLPQVREPYRSGKLCMLKTG